MRHWLRLHRLALTGTLKLFLQSPLTSLLNLLVVGIAIALPLGLYTVVSSLQTLAGRLPTDAQMTVFLRVDSGAGDLARVRKLLETQAGAAQVRHISKEAALQSLQAGSGMKELLAGLDSNPLPEAFAVQIKDPAVVNPDALAQQLRADPAVDSLQQDSDWAKRLEGLLVLGRESVWTIALLFGAGLLLSTANLVRMQILTRRDEIEVSTLIGATRSFVRRPFLYFAALQGLLGGLVGTGIVALVIARLNEPVLRLAELYAEPFALVLPDLPALGVALAVVVVVSLMGAVLAVGRHLHAMAG